MTERLCDVKANARSSCNIKTGEKACTVTPHQMCMRNNHLFIFLPISLTFLLGGSFKLPTSGFKYLQGRRESLCVHRKTCRRPRCVCHAAWPRKCFSLLPVPLTLRPCCPAGLRRVHLPWELQGSPFLGLYCLASKKSEWLVISLTKLCQFSATN